jgi:hypothetical protein
MRRVAAAGVLAALLASPAASEEATLICLSAGHSYNVGDFACIPACHGKQRYARCEVVAQKASWTFISDVCPTANLTPPDPSDVTIAPVSTAMSPIPIVVAMSAIDPAIAFRLDMRRADRP